MNLLDAMENKNYTLISVGDDEHFARRAGSMGLVPGTEFRLVRKQKKMPLLLFARDTLIAVNLDDAKRIEVTVNE